MESLFRERMHLLKSNSIIKLSFFLALLLNLPLLAYLLQELRTGYLLR